MQNKDKKHIIIYHGDMDGITSAAIVSKYLGENIHKEFRKFQYGHSIETSKITKDDIVWIVDFSFPTEIMYEIDNNASHVMWFDHHISAKQIPTSLFKNTTHVIDIMRSGCGITWDELIKDQDRPEVVNLVEDRDLWKFNYDSTREFNEWANLNIDGPEDFHWKTLLSTNDRIVMDDAIEDGKLLFQYKKKMIKDIVRRKGYYGFIKGHKACFVNSPVFISEIGDYIGSYHAEKEEDIVAVIYSEINQRVTFSLRSKSINVQEIAEKFGGGGHMYAAGFAISVLKDDFNKRLDNIRTGLRWSEEND